MATAIDYSDKYAEELTKAAALPTEYDREMAKANANKRWSEAIKKDIDRKKEELKVLWQETHEFTMIFQKITNTLRS